MGELTLNACCYHVLAALRRPEGFEDNLLGAMLARCGCFPDDWLAMDAAGLVETSGGRCRITPAGRKALRLRKGAGR